MQHLTFPCFGSKHDLVTPSMPASPRPGMLALHKQSPRTPQEKESLSRETEATDGQIDRLVYELYGLAEEEIKIVEGK